MKKRTTLTKAAFAVAASAALTLGALALAAPAQATTYTAWHDCKTGTGVSRDECRLMNRTTQTNFVQSSIVVARCTVATKGATCTITKGSTVTAQWGLAYTATLKWLGIQLSTATSNSSEASVSCTSPALAAGASWTANPIGTRWTYYIQQQVAGVTTSTLSTSPQKVSFRANPNQIHCHS